MQGEDARCAVPWRAHPDASGAVAGSAHGSGGEIEPLPRCHRRTWRYDVAPSETVVPEGTRAPFGGTRQTHHPDLSTPVRSGREGRLHRTDRAVSPGRVGSATHPRETAGASNSEKNSKRAPDPGTIRNEPSPCGSSRRTSRHPAQDRRSRAGRERSLRRKARRRASLPDPPNRRRNPGKGIHRHRRAANPMKGPTAHRAPLPALAPGGAKLLARTAAVAGNPAFSRGKSASPD